MVQTTHPKSIFRMSILGWPRFFRFRDNFIQLLRYNPSTHCTHTAIPSLTTSTYCCTISSELDSVLKCLISAKASGRLLTSHDHIQLADYCPSSYTNLDYDTAAEPAVLSSEIVISYDTTCQAARVRLSCLVTLPGLTRWMVLIHRPLHLMPPHLRPMHLRLLHLRQPHLRPIRLRQLHLSQMFIVRLLHQSWMFDRNPVVRSSIARAPYIVV